MNIIDAVTISEEFKIEDYPTFQTAIEALAQDFFMELEDVLRRREEGTGDATLEVATEPAWIGRYNTGVGTMFTMSDGSELVVSFESIQEPESEEEELV